MTPTELLRLYTREQLMEHCSGMYLRWADDTTASWKIATVEEAKTKPELLNQHTIIVSGAYIAYHNLSDGKLFQEDIDAILAKLYSVYKPRLSRIDLIEKEIE